MLITPFSKFLFYLPHLAKLMPFFTPSNNRALENHRLRVDEDLPPQLGHV
jgi:hypothetical protein